LIIQILKNKIAFLCCICICFTSALVFSSTDIRVGSKRFTESYILSELISQTLEKNPSLQISRKPGLGNTGILFNALKNGDIDIYPEYLGTIAQEILHASANLSLEEANLRLKPLGLQAGYPLGFNNSYALAIRADIANQFNIRTISDLKNQKNIRLGLSHEFLARNDGWKRLQAFYQLNHITPNGLDHGLSYRAVDQGRIDVIDVYTTDANLATKKYLILEDDLNYFPSYEAVLLFREDFIKNPTISKQLENLVNQISVTKMQQMNFSMELKSQSAQNIASAFLENREIQN
jgi:osmoprotectant transport system permease protein